MKILTKLFLAAMISVMAMAAVASSIDGPNPLHNCPIRDLALIYQGGTHRIDWNEDEIEPYVTHTFADGHEDWLFDGFLFLEFKDGRGVQYSPGYDSINATRADWEFYLDRLFERGKALDALDKVIEKKKVTLGAPPFRHKVVLTVFVPLKTNGERGKTQNGFCTLPQQRPWGSIGSRALDLDCRQDQILAAQWFIDQLINRFAANGYKNLDLDALYWIDEDMVWTDDFPKAITDYIHGKGLRFIWIPYYDAPGHERWRELGFDIAYQQPNHFFDKSIPDSRLYQAVDTARTYGMGLELECDERAQSQIPDSWYDRMVAYVDAFEKTGSFAHTPMAYYTGYHLLLEFLRHPTPENRQLMDRLATLIISRRPRQ